MKATHLQRYERIRNKITDRQRTTLRSNKQTGRDMKNLRLAYRAFTRAQPARLFKKA